MQYLPYFNICKVTYIYKVRNSLLQDVLPIHSQYLLGGLFGGGLLSALLGKKLVVVVVGLAALLVAIAFGLNFGARSFSARSLSTLSEYMTEDNLITLADFVNRSVGKYD